jgi:hypothetical protein
MICPKCKSEYRVGFTKCADCKIELVEEIQENLEAENSKEIHPENPVEILQVMNHGDIAFIKSLLESENIIYLFYGESAMGKTWGASKARLFIDKSDTKKATELLVAAGML